MKNPNISAIKKAVKARLPALLSQSGAVAGRGACTLSTSLGFNLTLDGVPCQIQLKLTRDEDDFITNSPDIENII